LPLPNLNSNRVDSNRRYKGVVGEKGYSVFKCLHSYKNVCNRLLSNSNLHVWHYRQGIGRLLFFKTIR